MGTVLFDTFLVTRANLLSEGGTGLSRPTINRIVLSLKNKGVLERCGAKKNGIWKLLM